MLYVSCGQGNCISILKYPSRLQMKHGSSHLLVCAFHPSRASILPYIGLNPNGCVPLIAPYFGRDTVLFFHALGSQTCSQTKPLARRTAFYDAISLQNWFMKMTTLVQANSIWHRRKCSVYHCIAAISLRRDKH